MLLSAGALSNLTLKVDDTSNFFHCLVVESGIFELKGCDLTGISRSSALYFTASHEKQPALYFTASHATMKRLQ
jgi:hypothetical protein